MPRSSGLDALAWALPAAALVCAVAGLAYAFRKWRLAERTGGVPTDADYAIVEAALEADDEV